MQLKYMLVDIPYELFKLKAIHFIKRNIRRLSFPEMMTDSLRLDKQMCLPKKECTSVKIQEYIFLGYSYRLN
jgi:hypothetical protein